jgi:hypothetical protein
VAAVELQLLEVLAVRAVAVKARAVQHKIKQQEPLTLAAAVEALTALYRVPLAVPV